MGPEISDSEARDQTGIDLAKHEVTVLLVDDQRMIGEAVRRMLASESDINFHYCSDPTNAMDTAKEIAPTVILQDLVMPQIDGLTLVRSFRGEADTRDIPMIVLSTKEDPEIKAEAFACGANDYMVKFPDKLELIARIRYHSQGYITMLERNEAYQALVESQKKLEVRNRFIREMFGRYLSDEVVDSLLETSEGLKFGGAKREVTIMMSDLRGFTSLSESLPADKVVSMLNNYLGVMTDVILEYGGTIDEFIGDAILVIFGAPEQRPDDAQRAVACAVAMQRAIVEVNEWNRQHDLPDVEMGIGLNTGEVVVGNIGSPKRAKYGVVGTQVNLTGRVESFTVGGQIMITDSTLRAADTDLRIDGELEVEPKGVREPITLYEIGGIGEPFNLSVPREAEEMLELPEAIAISYTVLEGKRAVHEQGAGEIVRLSSHQAELRCSEPLEPMNNIRLRFAGADGDVCSDFYGKCLARPATVPGCFVVRFTSMPADVKERLYRTLEGDSRS